VATSKSKPKVQEVDPSVKRSMARRNNPPTRPVPVSGERVVEAPAKSSLRKAPKPITKDETNAVRRARNARKSWEKTPTGKERTRDITSAPGFENMSVGQAHAFLNEGLPEHKGPRVYDVQLPGMADPNAAPRPASWHELTDEQREHTHRALARHGTNIDQMSRDFGAQYDQSRLRARSNGEDYARAELFYSKGPQRTRIDRTAKKLGIHPMIHAQMNAMTSPQTKFEQTNKKTGVTTYPNDMAAEHAVKWVQSGRDPEKVNSDLTVTDTGKGKAQGFRTNIRKAAVSFKQHTEGVAPKDWVTSKDGKAGPFQNSPKTGPYANSWSDSHPQFFVSDVHSGGGGAVPHLSYHKNPMLDKQGKVKRDKAGAIKTSHSDRENAIASIPNFHAAVDHAAERAMAARGIGHKREAQGGQWGEEQTQRPDIPTAESGFPDYNKKPPKKNRSGPTENSSKAAKRWMPSVDRGNSGMAPRSEWPRRPEELQSHISHQQFDHPTLF